MLVPGLRGPCPNQGAASLDPQPTLESWVQALLHWPQWQEGMVVSASHQCRAHLPGWLVEAVSHRDE
jgi:hypothetical protein